MGDFCPQLLGQALKAMGGIWEKRGLLFSPVFATSGTFVVQVRPCVFGLNRLPTMGDRQQR